MGIISLAFTCYCCFLPAAVLGVPPGLLPLLHHLPSRREVVFAVYLQGEFPHAAPTRLREQILGSPPRRWLSLPAVIQQIEAVDEDLHRGRKFCWSADCTPVQSHSAGMPSLT